MIFPNKLWNSTNKTVVQIQEIHIVIEKQGEWRTYYKLKKPWSIYLLKDGERLGPDSVAEEMVVRAGSMVTELVEFASALFHGSLFPFHPSKRISQMVRTNFSKSTSTHFFGYTAKLFRLKVKDSISIHANFQVCCILDSSYHSSKTVKTE